MLDFYTLYLQNKPLDLQIRYMFLESVCLLVLLTVNGSEGGAFRLAVVYAPTGAEWLDILSCVDTFLGTFRTLVLVGDKTVFLKHGKIV